MSIIFPSFFSSSSLHKEGGLAYAFPFWHHYLNNGRCSGKAQMLSPTQICCCAECTVLCSDKSLSVSKITSQVVCFRSVIKKIRRNDTNSSQVLLATWCLVSNSWKVMMFSHWSKTAQSHSLERASLISSVPDSLPELRFPAGILKQVQIGPKGSRKQINICSYVVASRCTCALCQRSSALVLMCKAERECHNRKHFTLLKRPSNDSSSM